MPWRYYVSSFYNLAGWNQKKEEGEHFFGIEDLPYYMKKVEEQQFNLDFGELKQYFPVNLVLSGIFKIVQDLFGNYLFLLLFRLSNICEGYFLS